MTMFISSASRWLLSAAMGMALLSNAPTIAFALEGDALAQSCSIRGALVAGEGTDPTDAIGDYFAWNTNIPQSRVKAALAALNELDVIDATVFQGISAGNYYQTAIVAAALRSNSPIFMELRFERVNKTVRLTNVTFKDSLQELFPGAQPDLQLTAVTC